jgi:hypothetical protein
VPTFRCAHSARAHAPRRWKNVYLNEVAMMKVDAFLQTFIAYPPSQWPACFSVDQIRKRVDVEIDESFKKRGLE